jgi:endonuclease III-like uncharacterized protein
MERTLYMLFEDYFYKNNPKSTIQYDKFISLFVKLAKDPCDEKIRFVVCMLKHNTTDGVLTYSNIIEVSMYL